MPLLGCYLVALDVFFLYLIDENAALGAPGHD